MDPESAIVWYPLATKIWVSENEAVWGMSNRKYSVRAGIPEEPTKLTGTTDVVNESEIAFSRRTLRGRCRWSVGCFCDEGGEAFGVRNREGKFAEYRFGGLKGGDGVCALCEAYPAVASQ